MALDATVGGTSSDSYVTVAFADTYFGKRLYVTDWTAATNDDKEKALQLATVTMENQRWKGTKATTTQALEWPRNGTYDQNGYSYENDEIPTPIANGVCELALSLLGSDRTADTGTEGFKSMKVGPLMLTIDPKTQAPVIPDFAYEFIRYLLEVDLKSNMVPVLRS